MTPLNESFAPLVGPKLTFRENANFHYTNPNPCHYEEWRCKRHEVAISRRKCNFPFVGLLEIASSSPPLPGTGRQDGVQAGASVTRLYNYEIKM